MKILKLILVILVVFSAVNLLSGVCYGSYDYIGNTFSNAYVFSGNTHFSTIDYSTDIDVFQYTTTTNGIHTFETSSLADTFGEVYDSNQNLVAADNDGNRNFKLEWNCEAYQTYYVKVGVRNYGTGEYTLKIARGKTIPVIQYNQQPNEWLCWASCAAMVASYFNNDTINRTVPIAQQYWNSTTDYNRPISTDSQDIGTSVVNNTTGVSFHFTPRSLVGGDSSGPVYFNAQISYETIKTHIDNSYPIIASIYSDLTGGVHANVVKGYREENGNKYVIVNDPWNGNEYTIDFNDFTTVSYTTFYTGSVPVESTDEIEPNNSFETASNSKSTGNISISGDVDYYSFSTGSSCTYIFETTGTTDTYGELYDSDYNLIASDDNSGQDNNFKIIKPLPAMKKYYIKVRHKDAAGTGRYTIRHEQTGVTIKGYVKPDLSQISPELLSDFKIDFVNSNGVVKSTATTDSNGYFQLNLSGMEFVDNANGIASIVITKDGYLKRVIDNIELKGKVIEIGSQTAPISIWAGDLPVDGISGTQNNIIDSSDYNEIIKSYGAVIGSPDYLAVRDLDKDGAVTMEDIVIVLAHINAIPNSYPQISVVYN